MRAAFEGEGAEGDGLAGDDAGEGGHVDVAAGEEEGGRAARA